MQILLIHFGAGAGSGAAAFAAGPPATRTLLWLAVLLTVMVAMVALVVIWLRRGPSAPAGSTESAGRAAASAMPLICPACRRNYPTGTTFCAVDAQRLVSTQESGAAQPPAAGGKCPRCRRAYEPGTRFCPIDAEELVPLAVWQARHAGVGELQVETHDHQHLIGGDGKICPVCAAKYDLEASFCGRDGSELVTVN